MLLVDDQPLIRAGFRMILEAQAGISVVGEAGDGLEAVEVAADVDPDVVVMDIRMPRCDGVEATRRMPGRPVLMLTTFDLDEYVVEALRAGASGFLLKDAAPEELVHAVRVIAAGEALLAPHVTRRLLDHVVPNLRERRRPPSAMDELTEGELEVLRLMARGLSNQEIADQLHVSEATVKTHVSHVLLKFDLRDRVQAVVLAYELGLVQPGSTG